MNNTKNVNVSIVLHATCPDVFDELHQIVRASPYVDEIIVVDNSLYSCIDTNKYPDIVYVHRPDNPGYGAGHNIGIRKSLEKATYHLVINPDIHFNPEIIGFLAQKMDDTPDAGLMMPMIRYPDGKAQYLCRLLPNPLEMVIRRFFFGALRPLVRSYLELRELRFTGYVREMNVPFLSGCFMFLRCASLKEVGLFDERFFMYSEDLDLSRRIHEKYKTLFFPGIDVIHDHNRSSYKQFHMMVHHMRSIIKYFNKWGWFFDSGRRRFNRRALRALET